MLMPGPSSTATSSARVSRPSASPTRRDAARRPTTSRAPRRSGSRWPGCCRRCRTWSAASGCLRRPCGPSVTITAGMPSRSTGRGVPEVRPEAQRGLLLERQLSDQCGDVVDLDHGPTLWVTRAVRCPSSRRLLAARRQSSRCPQGAPYAVSRSRNGTASNASGPSTPAPDQTPVASSSSATTGLTAVCQTTHWWPYSAHRPLVVDHVVEVRRPGLAVLAGAGDPQPGAGLALHPVAEGRRVGQARRRPRRAGDLHALDPDLVGRGPGRACAAS